MQTYGTPMGSPLSPIISHIVMQDLEEDALNTLGLNMTFYFRYVDDVIMTIPENSIDDVLKTFNSIHYRLQFTFEIENHRLLHYRFTIKRMTSLKWIGIIKTLFLGRYLSYLSNHPLTHKIGVIYNLIDKALLLSNS